MARNKGRARPAWAGGQINSSGALCEPKNNKIFSFSNFCPIIRSVCYCCRRSRHLARAPMAGRDLKPLVLQWRRTQQARAYIHTDTHGRVYVPAGPPDWQPSEAIETPNAATRLPVPGTHFGASRPAQFGPHLGGARTRVAALVPIARRLLARCRLGARVNSGPSCLSKRRAGNKRPSPITRFKQIES